MEPVEPSRENAPSSTFWSRPKDFEQHGGTNYEVAKGQQDD